MAFCLHIPVSLRPYARAARAASLPNAWPRSDIPSRRQHVSREVIRPARSRGSSRRQSPPPTVTLHAEYKARAAANTYHAEHMTLGANGPGGAGFRHPAAAGQFALRLGAGPGAEVT